MLREKTNKRQSRHASQRGQSLVELGVGLLVMLPLLLFMLNCLYVAIGASLNDFVCRDAARAAACGAPSRMQTGTNRKVTRGGPKDRVLAIIKKVYNAGLPMKVREDVTVTETVRDVPPESDGGAIDGEVTVTTTIDIFPPVVVQGMNSNVVLKSKHSMPITYTRRANS